jgi:hypothetical protein
MRCSKKASCSSCLAPLPCREQVVQFIIQSTGGAVGPGVSVNMDPFTGAGAYVPPAAPEGALGGGMGSYAVTGGGADPFTGGAAAPQRPLHIPATQVLVYDAVPGREGIRRKILELNAAVPSGSQLAEGDVVEGGALDGLLTRQASVTMAAY